MEASRDSLKLTEKERPKLEVEDFFNLTELCSYSSLVPVIFFSSFGQQPSCSAKMNLSPVCFVIAHCYEARHLRLRQTFSRGTVSSEVSSAFRISLHIPFCLTERQMVCLPYPQWRNQAGENPPK